MDIFKNFVCMQIFKKILLLKNYGKFTVFCSALSEEASFPCLHQVDNSQQEIEPFIPANASHDT